MLGIGRLDELDRKLLQALQLDGRAPFSRIAAVLGWAGGFGAGTAEKA